MGIDSPDIDEQIKRFIRKPEPISRRTFLGKAAVGTATMAGSVWAGQEVGKAVGQKIKETLTSIGDAIELQGLTQAQKEAAIKFNTTKPEDRLNNLVVGPDGAVLRNEPRSSRDPEDNVKLYVGQLDTDYTVVEAIPIVGKSPKNPYQEDKWLVIPIKFDPKTKKVTVAAFSWLGNFKQTA